MADFKIKSSIEVYQMLNDIEKDNLQSYRSVLEYIVDLENIVSTYQSTLDQIQYTINSHNKNVTR